MRRLMTVVLALALLAPMALAEDLWLHVQVLEQGEDGDTVKVNVPLQLVEALLPLVQHEQFQGGKIKLDEIPELEQIDLRGVLEALDQTPDGEFVTVQSKDENVRVAKAGGLLLVNVLDDESTKVEVKVPLSVARALISADNDELDLLAAVRELAQFRGDLVSVEETDTSVRVWIDDRQQID